MSMDIHEKVGVSIIVSVILLSTCAVVVVLLEAAKVFGLAPGCSE